jgi:integrase
MTLIDLARQYHNRVGGSPGYLEQLECFVRRLPWKAAELSPDRIDAYLTDALRHLAPSTVCNHRKMLRCLLHFAAETRLVDGSILRPLRKVKRNPPNPRAWSHTEIRCLLDVAAKLVGGRKCPRSLLARAWILVGYSTGLRLDDLLSIRHDQIRGQRLCPSQRKVGHPHVCWLDDLAMAAIRELPVLGPRIFGDLICRDKAMAMMRQIVRTAGLPGSTKFLRRSGATYCEIAGKDASGHLGHRTPNMKAYYVDRLLLAEEKKQEPTTLPLVLADQP